MRGFALLRTNAFTYDSSSRYTYIGGFTLTQEDAKAYLYADSTKRRVHRWKDVKIKVFI